MQDYLLTIGAGGTNVHRLARQELHEVLGAERVEKCGQARVFFRAPEQPVHKFLELKTPEKLYAVVLRVPTVELQLPSGAAEAEATLVAAVVSCGSWPTALEQWRVFAGGGESDFDERGDPSVRQPRSFRVSGYRAGRLTAQLSSNGISEAVGEALADARGWQVDLRNFELEVVVHINDDILLVTLPLLERGGVRQANFALPGLAQPVAWAVARSANIAPGEVIVDPMCGSGIILLEAAQCWRDVAYLGFDIDEAQLRRFAANLKLLSKGHSISAARADATRLPLPDGCADAIVCDLPFGKQHGTAEGNAVLYPAAVAEFRRILRPGIGRAVLLTSHANSEMLAGIFALAPAEWTVTCRRRMLLGHMEAVLLLAEAKPALVYPGQSAELPPESMRLPWEDGKGRACWNASKAMVRAPLRPVAPGQKGNRAASAPVAPPATPSAGSSSAAASAPPVAAPSESATAPLHATGASAPSAPASAASAPAPTTAEAEPATRSAERAAAPASALESAADAGGPPACSQAPGLAVAGVSDEVRPEEVEVEARIARKSVHPGTLFCEALMLDSRAAGGVFRRWFKIPLDAAGAAPGSGAEPRAGDAVVVRGHWEQHRRQPRLLVSRWRILEAHRAVHGERIFLWRAALDAPGDDRGPVGVVLQCAGRRFRQLEQYCLDIFPQASFTAAGAAGDCADWMLLVRLAAGADLVPLLQILREDAVLSQVLRRMWRVEPGAILTFSAALERLRALAAAEGVDCVIHVQVHPRYLEQRAVDYMLDAGCHLSCANSSHVAALVYVDGVYYVGLARRQTGDAEGADGTVGPLHTRKHSGAIAPTAVVEPQLCRAQAKLREVLSRSGWTAELVAVRPRLALDVGAAPGGWSVCLSTAWGCKDVYAVDPGELAPGLLAPGEAAAMARCGAGRIRHLRMKWQEALPLLRAEGASLDVLTCDANMPCDQAVALVGAAAEFLVPRAYVVLTFKNCSKNRAEFAKLKADQIAKLQEFCTDVREVPLVTNRRLETTVLARGARPAPAA